MMVTNYQQQRQAFLIITILLGLLCHHGLGFLVPDAKPFIGRRHQQSSQRLSPLYIKNPLVRKEQDNRIQEEGGEDPSLRFDRTATSTQSIDEPCILTIDGRQYNMTAWAKAHPGGSAILQRFHNKDATKAFYASGHSQGAIDMLSEFLITTAPETTTEKSSKSIISTQKSKTSSPLARARTKLFTKEDPIGFHKYAGIFSLLHFAYRYGHTILGDVSAGFGTRHGVGASAWPLLCLIPHTLLSLSSLIFHTVPRERIVGRPMIWQEFRAHNIIFGMRHILCTLTAWTAIRFAGARRLATIGSCSVALLAMYLADVATEKLRDNSLESTTATMPYWEGCTVETQRKIKTFYAFSQFMATMSCTITWNPAWPLVCLFPIQIASLLMTLVRKGLLNTKGYHLGYGLALCLPYFSILRSTILARSWEVPALTALASIMFCLRRRGVEKYALWGTYFLFRMTVFDSLIDWHPWTL